MMGCLTAPIRLIGFLLLVGALIVSWVYRDELIAWIRDRIRPAPTSAQRTGASSPAALLRARRSLGQLGRSEADSVVLDADETASLVRGALEAGIGDQVDSLRVRLGAGRLGLSGSLRTARLPRELLGPMAVAVRDREPVDLEGPVDVVRPGVAAWSIDRARIRDFPLPREIIPRIIGRAFGDSTRRALTLTLPAYVRGIRITPGGVVLYGTTR